jgi:predicted small lipoprotein YifL
VTQRVTQKTESHENAPVLPFDLAVRVCDNVNMKPRIAAICAIVAFATCGGRAPAQFPDCAHISNEGQGGECQAAQEVYIVNDRIDGQVTVTIHVAMLDTPLPGFITSTDRVLTLEAGERQKLGCLLFAPQARYTWDLVDCQPL